MFSRILAPSLLVALAFTASAMAQNPSQQARGSSAASSSQGVIGADAQAVYDVAQQQDDAGQRDPAIASYKRFIKSYPASSLASKAQYRIAELLEQSGNTNRAFDAYQTLVTRYPDTPEFEKAVDRQIVIANEYLQGKRLTFLGLPIVNGTERAQVMYQNILKNAPFSKNAPIAQFNLGLTYERQGSLGESRSAYQTVLDKYPTSDVADDAMYQIAYIYMQSGTTGKSQDLSALVMARETFEDFLLQYPKSEKAAQARDNLVALGGNEAGDLMRVARYYDWSRNYKAAAIYYNDVIRKQPKTADAEIAKVRIDELRSSVGEDALRVGSERAETGAQLALRRRLQAQVETSALADYSGPSKRDIVPDELPVAKSPKLRTNMRDAQPLSPVEPLLPTE